MKVYEVRRIYDNGWGYEDNINTEDTIAICTTKERAEKWIADYTPTLSGAKDFTGTEDDDWRHTEGMVREIWYFPKYRDFESFYIRESEVIS